MSCNKTPISLMNELCKSNCISPQYKVIEESGPPHNRTFKVQLTLPNVGIYEGIASTIRAAKHNAAQSGLETSGLKKEKRKAKEVIDQPSIELNNIVMKLGKVLRYQDLPAQINQHIGHTPIASNVYGAYQYSDNTVSNSHYPYSPFMKTTILKIDDKEYIGVGNRKKDAKQEAALKALPELRKQLEEKTSTEFDVKGELANTGESETLDSMMSKTDGVGLSKHLMKSPISEVYEIAAKRRLQIDYQVVSSTGPPHSRTFVTTVTVGQFSASGEGSSKKVSKLLASSKVLEELKKLPPLIKHHAYNRLYKHEGYAKKSPKDINPSLNAISLLGQLRQRRKEELPEYALVEEGCTNTREFTMQIKLDSHVAHGSGANKKEAKKNAAEAMLQLLGIRPVKFVEVNDSVENSQKSGLEKNSDNKPGERRSLPPGLLPILPEMTEGNKLSTTVVQTSKPFLNGETTSPPGTVLNRAPGAPVVKPISDEILQNESISSMQKLQQLAKARGFQTQYQDITQENVEQHRAVVTLSTVPPLLCHGFGSTLDNAFENSAANALLSLTQPQPISTNGPSVESTTRG